MKIGQPADKPAAAPGAKSTRAEPTTQQPIKAGPGKPPVAAPAARSAIASTAPSSPPAATQTSNVESSANVQISRTAATMISSEKAVNADIDSEKVARVSQQISDNKYEVNAAAIADKLIANAQELLGKVSP